MPDSQKHRCRYQSDCAYYAEAGETASDRVLKQIFCANPPLAQGCAIYLRRSSSKPVPESLCPNGDVRLKSSETPENGTRGACTWHRQSEPPETATRPPR